MFNYVYIGTGGAIRTKSGTVVATSFNRIVCGGRGAYVEFDRADVSYAELTVPNDVAWRLTDTRAYFIELRTTDGVKVYFQVRKVDYADYKPGKLYIAPNQLDEFERSGKYIWTR